MNRYALSAVLFILVAVIVVMVFIASRSTPQATTDQLVVAATIFPLVDMLQQVGGDHVQVIGLVPPGANEHSYALTTQQVAQVAQAKTIFAIGNKLDDHLVEPLARTHSIPITPVDRGIALQEYQSLHHEEEVEPDASEHEHHDEGVDPHYWLIVPNAAIMAETVAEQLSALDPDHRRDYEDNLEDYVGELTALEQELQAITARASQKRFIAMHNAWSYLAKHYGFELVATYEPVEGSQPSLQDLQELKTVIAEHQIKTFYAEPQKVSSAAVRFLAKEFGLKIATLDPTGGIEERGSYIELMRFNITALAQVQ